MPEQNHTISDYMSHHETRSRSHKQYKQTLLYVALMCFAAGLVTWYFDFKVITVVVVPLGAIMFQSSTRYALLVDLMTEHYYLAQLIATQQSDLVALRSEVQKENHGKDRP